MGWREWISAGNENDGKKPIHFSVNRPRLPELPANQLGGPTEIRAVFKNPHKATANESFVTRGKNRTRERKKAPFKSAP